MDQPIRIFHLIKGLGRGGAEMLLSEGLKCADRDRFAFGYGYFLPWKDAMVSSLEAQGAPVVCFNHPRPIEMGVLTAHVTRHLSQWGADLVHCHLPVAGIVGRIAGRISNVPVVYTEHNLWERYHRVTRYASQWTWSIQKRVIAVSEEVATSIRKQTGSGVPVQVIRNGVSLDDFDLPEGLGASVRAQWNIPADAPVIGTVAVFRVQKQLDDWLRAARILLNEFPNIHFFLVGDGVLRGDLERLSHELGLSQRVHFVGLQTNVKPYLEAMDVYMMSSIFEGLPVALLEAMAARLPPVVTRAGGIPEIIEDGVNGILTPQRMPEVLAEAAARLLRDPGLRTQMGAAARERVKESFGMGRMAKELEQLYLSVLNRS